MLAFVWRADEITSAVVDAARRTRTRAIFDVSRNSREPELDAVGMALVQADAGPDVVDLKVGPEALKGALLEELHRETGINRIWVEFHPVLAEADLELYLQRIAELSRTFQCIPVTGDVEIINRVLRHHSGIRGIALKGCESSGFVGRETLFTLYPAVQTQARALNRPLELHVWGGVATPEAVAGFLSIGAAGIVFESLHWLTDLTIMGERQRQKISKLRPGHTDLTGLALNVPCRLFNKGNSRAVRELKKFAGSLCGAEIRDDHRTFFAARIEKEAVLPHEARFDADELVPLGVEATFAQSFTERFGLASEEAIERFAVEIEKLCSQAGKKEKAFVGSPMSRELGTRYPFVQGAMSWITDVPEFALKVAEAGGLPTIALGMMDKRALDEKLGKLNAIMEGRPYAVNVITLPENPYRDEQLAWIKFTRPRFTVIAAGEPAHAKELLEAGLEVIYIAPNEELLQLACEAGVRFLICEGNEAGGHVGENTTLTLAQTILDRKHRDPSFLEGRKVIFAGGFCNRETAFLGAMLGAEALQMGTAYLATREIVETGALTALYQRMVVNATAGDTVLTGEGTGLRIRSLRTPMIEQVCSLEREFGAGSEEEAQFRHKIEMLTAGSLLVAARGVDKPGGKPLDEQACIEQGQFMSGACAAAVNEVRTLEELHMGLAEANLPEGLPFLGPIREAAQPGVLGPATEEVDASRKAGRTRPATRQPEKERIAITGMSIVNSLGNSLEEVWAASAALRTGIIEVPPSKWDHAFFYDPRPRVPDKTYCRVGAFQNIEVSRKELGIAPQDFRTMTDSTKVTLWMAHQAIMESGILDSDIPRERIAVLVSQNAGEAAATLRDVILRGTAHHTVQKMGKVVPLTQDAATAVEEELKSGLLQIDDTTLLGRLNCTAGGFICNKYGFMGPSFSVSAACASALVALYSAYQMIRNGIIDAAVLGGAEEPLTAMHFLEFAAIGALAGLSGVQRPAGEVSRPFDADRDGMVLGEGGGMIVIERESVARKRGARVHAYVTSMGGSNNHLGMVESSRITQEIAIRASFKDASYGPDKVELVECHATSTMQGDVEEVHALGNVFGSGKRTFLTSFKSQIGHTLGAAGINSLIRGVMAMNSSTFPPTINYQTPDPEIELEKLGFWVPREPVEWPRGNGEPRRMEVNAFGFGGSNYVVQVEEVLDGTTGLLVSLPEPAEAPREEAPGVAPPDGISFFRTEIGGNAYRLAVVADNEQERRSIVEQAEPIQVQGPVPPKRLRAMTRKGLHLGQLDEAAPPLAFVFPGQGSHYAGMSHELYQTFPVIREWMDRASEVAEFDILHLLFHDREEDLQKTRWQQPALFTMEYAMVQYLTSLGIRPTAMAGHSLGELTALCLAGVYSFEDGFRLVNMRAICMDKACTINIDGGIMMAVDAPLDYLEKRIAETPGIYVTNINSPHQVVLGGGTELVKAFGEDVKKEGFRRTVLRVSMAFHSPIMRCIHDELQAFVDTLEFHPPKIPVISNTTKQPYPSDPSEIKKIVMAHLESPVHWMDNVRTLWNDFGVRLFVEVGPREILSNLIADSIEDAECIQTCLPSAESMIYRTALAQLYAKGHLKVGSVRTVTFPGQEKPAPRGVSAPTAPAQKAVAAARPEQTLERIIQREINAFVYETFGRFLSPILLAAIRKDYDPRFGEEDLKRVLGQMVPGVGAPSIPQMTYAPAAVPAGAVTAAPAPQPAAAGAPEPSSVAEAVIRIIMDATGYERDEISAEMDLREDLAIRSSRLPVIMDSLEGHFGIKIEIEQFMNVRTIQDIADKIAEIVGEDKGPAVVRGPRPEAECPAPAAEPEEATEEGKQSLKRLTFFEVPLEKGEFQPIELDTMESVAVLSAVGGNELTKEVSDVLRRDYGVSALPLAYMQEPSDGKGDGFNLYTDEGASFGARLLEQTQSLSGVVLILDDLAEERLTDLGAVPLLLRGFFTVLKPLLESPVRKFALLVHKSKTPQGPVWVLAEGLLGFFLSLAHEFPSVQFRSVRLDANTPMRIAIRESLDRNRHPVETIYRDGEAFTLEGRVVPTVFGDNQRNVFNSGDVVVLSGGGQGITYHLARSLVPFGCRIVFLGRTRLDPDIDFRRLISEGASEERVRAAVKTARPDLAGEQLAEAIAQASRAVEVIGNVEALREMGADTAYYSCDVADEDRTRFVFQEVIKRYGRIDGIVHGAGIVRDSLARDMTPEDFAAVVDIKYRGALNLLRAAQEAGLKFLVCLSSVAATLGNVGQSNYSTANRAMSALMTHVRASDDSRLFKALMLSPIEGAGMAENPEIRAMMRRKKASYVHVEELVSLFQEEMRFAPADDEWVQFMRTLPDHQSARIDQTDPLVADSQIQASTVTFNREDFPMVDSVVHCHIPRGELNATRVFSREKDLWITDHKPFKSLKYPLVSAIMVVETFTEACRILYPYLHVRGIRDVQFLDIIECPPGVDRSSLIACKRKETADRDVLCEVSLSTQEISPSGQPLARHYTNYKGAVILGSRPDASEYTFPGFPVTMEELESRPMAHDECMEKYGKRSDLKGRYCVIHEIDGASPTGVHGRIVYRHREDFAAPMKSRYQFAPYLLEALMHLARFHQMIQDENEEKSTIPYRIGEVLFFGEPRDGETVTVEGRLKKRDQEGITFEARAVDTQGRTLMYARDLLFRWFSE
jgi:malonyl CoA-acyl carrier protein transacylase